MFVALAALLYGSRNFLVFLFVSPCSPSMSLALHHYKGLQGNANSIGLRPSTVLSPRFERQNWPVSEIKGIEIPENHLSISR